MSEEKTLSGLVAANLDSFNATAQRLQDQMHKLELELVKVRAEVGAAKELEKRVTALENWRWFIMGISAAVGAIASKITGFFSQ